MNIGDIVNINGVNRVVTRIDGDKFFSTPCGDIKEPEIEEIKVEKPKTTTKRKKK